MGFFGKLVNWFRGKGFKEADVEMTHTSAPEQQIQKVKQEFEVDREGLSKAPEPIDKGKAEPDISSVKVDKTSVEPEVVKAEETESEKQMKKAVEIYDRAKSVELTEAKLDKDTVNTFEFNFKADNHNEMVGRYRKLLSANAKLNDPEVLDTLIENRAKLKHRFSAKIIMYDNIGVVAFFNMAGCLIEEAELVHDFFRAGQSYESPMTLSAEIMGFIAFVNENHALKGWSHPHVENRANITITRVVVNESFA